MNTEAGQKVTVLTKIDMNKENIDIIYVVFKHIEHVWFGKDMSDLCQRQVESPLKGNELFHEHRTVHNMDFRFTAAKWFQPSYL
jgi:hypothetical protein